MQRRIFVRSSRRQADSKYWHLGPPQSGRNFLERRGREYSVWMWNTSAVTSTSPGPNKSDGERGYIPSVTGVGSHSKCVFTSDRVMTNNGALLDGSFQDSTQHDVREKRSGMTDDHGKAIFSGQQEKRREARSKEQVAELGQSAGATSWISWMKKESFHSRNLDLLRSLSLVSSFSSSFFVLVALCLRLIEERRRGEKNHDSLARKEKSHLPRLRWAEKSIVAGIMRQPFRNL